MNIELVAQPVTYDPVLYTAMEANPSTASPKTGGRTFAEFFAGIGLMRMGLERAGWTIAFANDIDAHKQAMYSGHFQDMENHPGSQTIAPIHFIDALSTLATFCDKLPDPPR